jgi:hypothetical protein
MIALVLNPAIRAEIDRVVAYAHEHRYTLPEMMLRKLGHRSPPGDNPEHVVVVPLGFRCVYTVDQNEKRDWFRHLSVSLPDAPPESAPAVAAVQLLIGAFGFVGPLEKCGIWLEDTPTGHKAVNVVEKLPPES